MEIPTTAKEAMPLGLAQLRVNSVGNLLAAFDEGPATAGLLYMLGVLVLAADQILKIVA